MPPERRLVRYNPYPSPRSPHAVLKRLVSSPAVRQAASSIVRKVFRPSAKKATKAARSAAMTNYVTTQHDTAKQYRFKRMPRYKRKRWVKKVKQNAAMDYALAGTRTVMYNGSLEMPIRTDDIQGWVATHLYANNGTAETIDGQNWEFAQSDIPYLLGRDPDLFDSTKLNKFRFMSAVLDITCRNSSTNNLGLEVDLYVIKYNQENAYKSLKRMEQSAVDNALLINTSYPLNLEQRGATPFDITGFAALGLKVISKQKFFLPNGDTFTYQYRDPKNHAYGANQKDNAGFALPYQTTTLLCTFKPIVGGNKTDAKLTMGATRTYRYAIVGQNAMAADVYPTP